jgi:BirA family biotin operon repressor/biotin-[acetyl-CoA-carboxylase] ligase
VALTAAVVLIEAIERWVPPGSLGIRWPNDVEAGGRKLAGMLPENRLTARGPRLALGVGLNVRSRLDQAPDELRRLATSVERLAGCPVSADAILADFLSGIGPALDALGRDDPGLAQRWGELDQLAGQVVRIRLPDRPIEGRAIGIDARGALRVATAEGEHALLGGQVLRDNV